MSEPIRIGMIGYGFMGRAHTNAYKRVPDFFPRAEIPTPSCKPPVLATKRK